MALAFVQAVWPALAQLQTIEAITRAPEPHQLSGETWGVELSGDGRWAVFASSSNGLVPDDNNDTVIDLFLRNIPAGETTLITRGYADAGADGNSTFPIVSTDGRWVIFQSDASNLVEGDSNGGSDIFAFERETGKVTILSQTATSGKNGQATLLSAAPDARFVVFSSMASDLVAGDSNDTGDIFYLDRETRQLELLTKNADTGGSTSNGFAPYFEASVSSDGRRVAFTAPLFDIMPFERSGFSSNHWAKLRGKSQLFLWDAVSKTNRLLSPYDESSNPSLSSLISSEPAISANGGRIVFLSSTGAELWSYSLATELFEQITSVTNFGLGPDFSIDADASRLAFTRYGQVLLHDFAAKTNWVISASPDGNPGSNPSHSPEISADGSTVLFLSGATELFGGEPTEGDKILKYDRLTGKLQPALNPGQQNADVTRGVLSLSMNESAGVAAFVIEPSIMRESGVIRAPLAYAVNLKGTNPPVLISSPHPGLKGVTAQGRSLLESGAMSLDGRYLAFVTSAALAQVDTNGTFDLYLRDRLAGETRWLGHAIEGATNAQFVAFQAMSANGKTVLFTSRQQRGGANITSLLAYDTSSKSLITASILTNNVAYATNASGATVSADGKTVGFLAGTRAYVRTLPFGPTRQIFAGLDRPAVQVAISPGGKFAAVTDAGVIRALVNLENGQSKTNLGLYALTFSPDDRTLFYTRIGSTPDSTIWALDLATFTSNRVATSVQGPMVISADSAMAVYVKRSLSETNLYAHNLETGETRPLMLDGQPIWPRWPPAISADGRYVAVLSTNIVAPGSWVRFHQLHLFDLWSSNVFLVSKSVSGAPGDGPTSSPCLSADGRIIAFDSMASDLVADDLNETSDVFVAQLATTDANNNGLEDGWEARFLPPNTAASADTDNDGATNLQEFLAGTDPSNPASLLALDPVTPIAAMVDLWWNAVAGRTYQVQYRISLNEGDWTNVGAPVVAVGSRATAPAGAAPLAKTGFYRVVLLTDPQPE